MQNHLTLEMRNITKAFAGVVAVNDVTLEGREGEVLAIVGENGAGKSTLMKVLAGVYPIGAYSGEVIIAGTQCRFSSVGDAHAQGVAMIPQELTTVNAMSVAENMFLNHEPHRRGVVNWDKLFADSRVLIDRFQIGVDPRTAAGDLSPAQQQLMAIASAFSQEVRILILDEPTSSLTETETTTLFENITRLKQDGVLCLYITHRLREVFSIADRVAVLRDGHLVGVNRVSDTSGPEVVKMMVGRTISDMYPKKVFSAGEVAVAVRDLTVFHQAVPDRKLVDKVSFEWRRGEILGLFGLLGSGRTELATALFGAWPGHVSGAVYFGDRRVQVNTPVEAVAEGLGLVPEDRKSLGLILKMVVRPNISLASLERVSRLGGVINSEAEIALVRRYVQEVDIRVPSLEVLASQVSGGNQQKIVVAKWLAKGLKMLLLDEPTRGIDVGAKVEIYNLLNHLVDEGVAVLLISSELPEILGMCDRIMVMCEGRLAGQMRREDATEELIMSLATGGQ